MLPRSRITAQTLSAAEEKYSARCILAGLGSQTEPHKKLKHGDTTDMPSRPKAARRLIQSKN